MRRIDRGRRVVNSLFSVIPAKAGIPLFPLMLRAFVPSCAKEAGSHEGTKAGKQKTVSGIPAFAGMTVGA
jgi:hypothetical protein